MVETLKQNGSRYKNEIVKTYNTSGGPLCRNENSLCTGSQDTPVVTRFFMKKWLNQSVFEGWYCRGSGAGTFVITT
jgi:hypothetical protein